MAICLCNILKDTSDNVVIIGGMVVRHMKPVILTGGDMEYVNVIRGIIGK